MTFTIEQFMFNIDKFFSKDPNVVLKEIDNEFVFYIAQQLELDKELVNTAQELDDFFFEPTEPDKDQEADKRDKEANELIEGIDKTDSNPFKVNLQKTIINLQEMIAGGIYKTVKEHSEGEKLLRTLVIQLNNIDKGEIEVIPKIVPVMPVVDLQELRDKGI